MYKYIVVLASVLFAFASTQAYAAKRQPRANCVTTDVMRPDIVRPCVSNNFLEGVRSIKVTMRRVSAYTPESPRRVRSVRRHRVYEPPQPYQAPRQFVARVVGAVQRVAEVATQFLPHPAGCPRSAFCGCGAAKELGLSDRTLWLARSWYKFPRSAPAPNTVAVRPHHVFVLKQHIGGDKWLVADYNSGRRLSRLHVRSISGYTIVSPG